MLIMQFLKITIKLFAFRSTQFELSNGSALILKRQPPTRFVQHTIRLCDFISTTAKKDRTLELLKLQAEHCCGRVSKVAEQRTVCWH